jgi:hypothetical protein
MRSVPLALCLLVAAAPEAWRPVAHAEPAGKRPLERKPPGGPGREDVPYLKGALHLHSSGSSDSATPPAQVARWYARRGYDFIVFTDHNVITRPPAYRGLLTFTGVELTQNLSRCLPPPGPGLSCLLHMNALFVSPDAKLRWPPLRGAPPTRLEVYSRALEVARSLGAIAQLNHPNFHFAVDAKLAEELVRRGTLLLEIANQAHDSANRGDARHPSTEALWDAVLTAGAWPVYGVASDDAHHYDDAAQARARGEPVFPGDLGFVMVRAAREPLAIRGAMARGEFYASTGVILRRVELEGGELVVEVADRARGQHRFRFVGRGGEVRCPSVGREARCAVPQGAGAYLRAVVEDARGRRAWTQPVRGR